MINNNIDRIYLFLFSLIPISIIVGSSVSLINILIILIIFLVFSARSIKREIFSNSIVIFLIFFYFYLIFNSLIAVNFEMSATRNFGFIRYILLFIAINYFFNLSNKKNNIFSFWSLIIFIVTIDCFIEFYFGKNIFGYGELYGNRIVSFFKDEPIVGAYLSGFIFIIIGYFFDKFIEKDLRFKLLLILIIFTLFSAVLITGERSNGIKVMLGLILFFILHKRLSLKFKILTLLGVILIFLSAIANSSYLKNRYYNQFIYHFHDSERLSKFVKKQNYFELYRSGIAVFKDNPFFGVGNKNFRVVTSQYENIKDDYEYSTHPHQIYFELLSEHGAIGTIIILLLIFTMMFKNLKIIILSRNSIQLGCLTYLIINFLPLLPSGSFFADFNSTLFWLNLSIMYACNPKTNIFKKNGLTY
tara:strand:- start:79 stop:1326 length:1248 start_codon:yes stop_codon:yes gene_type:complete